MEGQNGAMFEWWILAYIKTFSENSHTLRKTTVYQVVILIVKPSSERPTIVELIIALELFSYYGLHLRLTQRQKQLPKYWQIL